MGIEAPGFIHCLHLKQTDNKQLISIDEQMKELFRKTYFEKRGRMHSFVMDSGP